jgi:Tfp pilus assembly protein FimV
MALFGVRAEAAEDPVIGWADAEKFVGQRVVVEGRVLGIHCSPTSCLLAFDPTFNRFTAVVQAKDFKSLPAETLNANYVGRQVRLRGTVRLLEKKPEIIIDQPSDLEVVVSKQERAEKREEVAYDLVDRLDDVLDRLDELTTRMADSQARLEQVAQALAVQSQQLAAMQAALNAPAPETPQRTWGEPQPRPAFEALRTIKRGMTADEVTRLIGTPNVTESNSTGGFIWDYGYGRTVTFDQRGRAVSMIGFPAP